MPLRRRRTTKKEKEAASILEVLSRCPAQVAAGPPPDDLGDKGNIYLHSIHQNSWLFYWSSPETTSSKGVVPLVCLSLSSGDDADKKLVKKADLYTLAGKAGL